MGKEVPAPPPTPCLVFLPAPLSHATASTHCTPRKGGSARTRTAAPPVHCPARARQPRASSAGQEGGREGYLSTVIMTLLDVRSLGSDRRQLMDP